MNESPRFQLAVSPERLARRVELAQLPATTAEVSPLEGTIGQSRALDALAFGLEIHTSGYNLFVAGPTGSGRERTVLDFLRRFAPTRPAPSDWVYVYNFAQPDHPNAIPLPQGRGRAFAADIDSYLQAAQREIPRAFESEDYARHRREALSELARQREDLLNELQSFAHDQGFTIEITPSSIVTVPVREGRPLSPEEFQQLPTQLQQELEQRIPEVQERIAGTLRQLHQLQKEAVERIRQLDRDVARFTLGPHLDELREMYSDQPKVLAYLDQVQSDLPEHLDDFRGGDGEGEQQTPLTRQSGPTREERLARYRINVFVDHDDFRGAPVIVERNPTYYNLAGRIDYRATFGALVADFRQIKPGALQRANGGFLVLHILDVLRAPLAWEALKRSLRCGEVTIENLGEQYSALPTEQLRPESIPLDVKVILLGPPEVYALLYQADPDFQELFKVKADFAPDMDWNDEHLGHYMAFISQRVREEGLHHFDRSALGRIIEYGARLREDQRKLSTRLRDIADVVSEANYWAAKSDHDLVQAADVDQAIAKRKNRSNLIEERLQEWIDNGTILIDTVGARAAQVNGMAVIDLGGYAFGRPSRITARVSPGRGSVQSIEREIELSGPIHSKGFLILSGYLSGQYAQQYPLALSATITFEQSYDEVDGDSASSTELYALLSALADLPLAQGIAVTGSVNQHGEIQAVGGVNAKIEGFFAVCKAKGLTGDQGVILPAANVPNLMLEEVVIDAVRAGQFHIWGVCTIDEGIELLTGRPAGERVADGQYPEGTVHRLVEDRLRDYAECLRTFSTDHRTGAERAPRAGDLKSGR
ncbi:MAG TPA: ATP-binding protein [Ktedonobacterales bacterium]|jgi:predicted ATP-dependent protease